ncbi:hypothetical protein [Myroides pelagicus]|uniref:Curlin n=1 Tax=Myroides pelagicus TaxID=270914 RepID=A0A7K1GNZ9_9FLAO|nr:hypothetical protein [Myroides pelagicus]MTH30566.1 hypothetical protein [Myroides pelagicus]
MKAYFVFAFIFCLCFHAMAQNNSIELEVIQHKTEKLIHDTTKGILNQTTINRDNLVAVSQIGQDNVLQPVIGSNGYVLSYTQQGNNNLIDIVAKGEQIKHNIAQYGDQNLLESYNLSSGQQSLQVIQMGNRQEVLIFGENSMSKDMKISIQGNDKQLLIRNFN